MFKPYLMIKRKAFMTYTNPNTAARKKFSYFFPLQFTSGKRQNSLVLASEFKGQRVFKFQFRPDIAYKLIFVV